MYKINIIIINFFYYVSILYNCVWCLIMPDSYFSTPKLNNMPVVLAIDNNKTNIKNITNRFVYLLLAINCSSTIAVYWTYFYCKLYQYKKITYNGKKFIDDYPFSVVEID